MKINRKYTLIILSLLISISLIMMLVPPAGKVYADTDEPARYELTSGSSSGYVIDKSGVYTLTASLEFTNSSVGGSGITLADGTDVTIIIPRGMTLTAVGASAQARSGAGAGICVPETALLTVKGEGALIAVGGNAASGAHGFNGVSGIVDEDQNVGAAGNGGNGGSGGGGAGAGIGGTGGNGGRGGAGGQFKGKNGEKYTPDVGPVLNASECDDEEFTCSGAKGSAGEDGTGGSNCGSVTIQTSVDISGVKGGAAGNDGLKGAPGGHDCGDDWLWTNAYASGGGGGGGGGAAGAGAERIGGGGAGGAGGGGGGSGANHVMDDYDSRSYAEGSDGGAGGHKGCPGVTVKASRNPEIGSNDDYGDATSGDGGDGGANGLNGKTKHISFIPSDSVTDITGSGEITLQSGTYRVSTPLEFSSRSGSGITVADNAAVCIIIEEDASVTAQGYKGKDIYVPASSYLTITGDGSLITAGGFAGGSDGCGMVMIDQSVSTSIAADSYAPAPSGSATLIGDYPNGLLLNTGSYTVSPEGLTCINKDPGGSGIEIAAGADVKITIPAGTFIDAKGCDAVGAIGAGAGIYVPAGASLTIEGEGTLRAKGGNAASGEAGKNGENAMIVKRASNLSIPGMTVAPKDFGYGGNGGAGGNGGGGAGAGIGGVGGNGGIGGKPAFYTTEVGLVYKEHFAAECEFARFNTRGTDGNDGGSGANASDYGSVTVNVSSCEISGGEAGADPTGNAVFGSRVNDEGTNWLDDYSAGGGGGGGNGAGGLAAQDIGSGGGGGGAGGSGGSGGTCVVDDWGGIEKYRYPVGGKGGNCTAAGALFGQWGSEAGSVRGGTGGAAGVCGGAGSCVENKRVNLFAGSDSGFDFEPFDYTVIKDAVFTSRSVNSCALTLPENTDITITIPEGLTLAAFGKGSSAAIKIPESSRLIIKGKGNFIAVGGTNAVAINGGEGVLDIEPTVGAHIVDGYTIENVVPGAEGGLPSGGISTFGAVLESGTYTVTDDLFVLNKNKGGSGISIAEDSEVTIIVPKNVSLIAKGCDAYGTTGAGAGIFVPEGSSLTIKGDGRVVAVGGNAANGGSALAGRKGAVTKNWNYPCYGGDGGSGGTGGGGAGSGIGGSGGSGGLGGRGGVYIGADKKAGTENGVDFYTIDGHTITNCKLANGDWKGNAFCVNGRSGSNGEDGQNGSGCGDILIDGVNVTAVGGNPGSMGARATDNGTMFHKCEEFNGDLYYYCSGGMGGPGAGGFGADDIGGGAGGGAGGGSGGSGATIMEVVTMHEHMFTAGGAGAVGGDQSTSLGGFYNDTIGGTGSAGGKNGSAGSVGEIKGYTPAAETPAPAKTALVPSGVTKEEQTDARENWISALSDDMRIAQLNMPGTHNSCTKNVLPLEFGTITEGGAICNDKTINEQLAMGIRSFDIRWVYENQDPKDLSGTLPDSPLLGMSIYHGYESGVKSNFLNYRCVVNKSDANGMLTVRRVLQDLKEFLDEHPDEIVFITMKKEGSGFDADWTDLAEAKEAEKAVLNDYDVYTLTNDDMYNATLGDLRGRIVQAEPANRAGGTYGDYDAARAVKVEQLDYCFEAAHSVHDVDNLRIEYIATNLALRTVAYNYCNDTWDPPMCGPDEQAEYVYNNFFRENGKEVKLGSKYGSENAYGVITLDFPRQSVVDQIINLNNWADRSDYVPPFDPAEALAVDELIGSIGTVTLDSEDEIVEARAALKAAPGVQQSAVKMLAELEEAERILAELKRKYDITVTDGTAYIDDQPVTESRRDTAVSIKANDPERGKRFTGWRIDSGLTGLVSPTDAETSFIMPPCDVALTAMYEDIPKYKVSVEGGYATADGATVDSACEGDTVTLHPNADTADKKFKQWEAVSGKPELRTADGVTTFVMPANDVAVRAEFQAVNDADDEHGKTPDKKDDKSPDDKNQSKQKNAGDGNSSGSSANSPSQTNGADNSTGSNSKGDSSARTGDDANIVSAVVIFILAAFTSALMFSRKKKAI